MRPVGALSETDLEQLIARGCTGCGSDRLAFRSYVDLMRPLAAGEPVGSTSWVYDGEKFVDGVFAVSCAACKRALFADDCCPRCNAAGALPTILATENRWPVPLACATCSSEEVLYVALVPARISYEGKRADTARTSTEMHDPGFHGHRLACVDCGAEDALIETCPLCAAPAPLRPRP